MLVLDMGGSGNGCLSLNLYLYTVFFRKKIYKGVRMYVREVSTF